MKKYSVLTMLAIFLFVSCRDVSPKSIEGQINPGDEIDGTVFHPIDEIDWNISLAFLCDFESGEGPITDNTIPCYTRPGNRIFFGNCFGVGSETAQDIDDLWQDFVLEVTFDDQKVNLPPFGYLDFEPFEPAWQYIRIWNLMVENITTGTHIIRCVEEIEDGIDSTTYVFTVSDQPETYPNLSQDISTGVQLYTSQKANLNYAM